MAETRFIDKIADTVLMIGGNCSMRLGDRFERRIERRFFDNVDYSDIIEQYPREVDKIIVFNDPYSTIDFDAKRTRDLFLNHQLPKSVDIQNSQATILYGLDYLINSDRRVMFSFEVPVDGKEGDFDEWGREKFRPKLNHGWEATLSAPFGQVLNVDYWVVFYRRLNDIKTDNLRHFLERGAVLGFFCKGCNKHYSPDELKFSIKHGHRSAYEAGYCPKKIAHRI